MANDPKALRRTLDRKLGARMRMWLDICANCGLCADACHFHASDPKPWNVPAYRVKPLRSALKRNGRLADEELEHMARVAFGSCTMCMRCAMFCPFGINIAALVRTARCLCVSQGMTPRGLALGMENSRVHGNNLALSKEDYLETIEWQVEELREEMPGARAPMDVQGARTLVTLHPRDVKFQPQNLYSYLKLYNASDEDFTFTSVGWDSTNLGLFAGDDEAAGLFASRVVDAAERLGVRRVCTAE